MNILFVHSHILRKKENNYYSTGGVSSKILKRYLQDNTDIIYTYNREKAYEKDEKLVQVNDEKVICIPTKIYHGPKDYYLHKIKIREEIKERLKNKDLCIIRIPDMLSEEVYKEAQKQQVPCVIEMAGCAWDSLWYYGNFSGKILAIFRYFQVKKIVRNSKYVIYVSNEFLQKKYPTKGKNIGCSNVNIEMVDEKILENRLEKIKNKDNKKYKIGLIGSLNVAYKGHETAIKAVARLKGKYTIELHFLGSGNNERWKKIAKAYNVEENVFFDGTLPGGDPVYNWLDGLDLFLIPSLTEGLPRALIEAMSRGCPCIGTKVGGIPELLEEEYIFKIKNAKKIAKKIDEIFTQKEKTIQQAKRNFEKAKEYSKDILNTRRKNFFVEVRKDVKEKYECRHN